MLLGKICFTWQHLLLFFFCFWVTLITLCFHYVFAKSCWMFHALRVFLVSQKPHSLSTLFFFNTLPRNICWFETGDMNHSGKTSVGFFLGGMIYKGLPLLQMPPANSTKHARTLEWVSSKLCVLFLLMQSLTCHLWWRFWHLSVAWNISLSVWSFSANCASEVCQEWKGEIHVQE